MNVAYLVVYGVLVMCDVFVQEYVVMVVSVRMAVEAYVEMVHLECWLSL